MDWLREVMSPGWVSSAIGLVGLAIALIIYRASLVGARPVYQRRALRLIGPDEKALPEEVEIRFKGDLVERLTKTLIVFWNSGKTLLRGSDIVSTDPLRFDFSEGSRILRVRVTKTTRATNKCEVSVDPDKPNSAMLTFDYLDPGDGAVVELLHTDPKRYPEIIGTIRGVPKGISDWGSVPPSRSRDLRFSFGNRRDLLLVVVSIGLLTSALAFILPDNVLRAIFEPGKPANPARLRRVIAAAGAIYVALPLLLLWLARRRFPRDLSSPEVEE